MYLAKHTYTIKSIKNYDGYGKKKKSYGILW